MEWIICGINERVCEELKGFLSLLAALLDCINDEDE
jgi:hypothetical protein